MNEVEMDFIDKAIIRGGILLFSRENAMAFIIACQQKKIGILGIDGFLLKGDKIQPSIENSIDFSAVNYQGDLGCVYTQAANFLKNKDRQLLFEIICSDE